MRQPFIFQLLGACCLAEPFIIPGPTDARCGAELVHRPMIRFMQFLDGLIGFLMTHSAEVWKLIPAPANLLIFLLYRQLHF